LLPLSYQKNLKKSRIFAIKKTIQMNGQIFGGGVICCNVSHPRICNIREFTGNFCNFTPYFANLYCYLLPQHLAHKELQLSHTPESLKN